MYIYAVLNTVHRDSIMYSSNVSHCCYVAALHGQAAVSLLHYSTVECASVLAAP
jgi:hypothetical protein